MFRFQRRLKLEFLRADLHLQIIETTWKRWKKKTQGKLETTHQHQKTEVFPEGDLCCFQPCLFCQRRRRQTDVQSVFCCLFSLLPFCQFLPVALFFWWGFLSFCLPSFPFSHFLPLSPLVHFVSMSVSLRGRLSPEAHRDWLAANAGSRLVYGSGKLHVSCFSAWN